MAVRTDLTMLQNIHRKLRTGLWHIPPQWRALRRVPGWSYPSVPIKRIRVPHQHLYPLLFQRLPMLRLEGHRLGETAVESTGSSTSARTLTQRMVLRWHHLMSAEGISLPDAFEQIKWEFRAMLQNFQDHLVKARSEAIDRHSKLSLAKIKRDALHEELGRPERYAEKLEELVNRALHLQPQEPHQYFSVSMSRKLLKQLNKEQVRAGMTAKTAEIQKQLDLSPLGRRSHELVAKRGGPAVPAVIAQADAEAAAALQARVTQLGASGAGGALMPTPHTPIQPVFASSAERDAAQVARETALADLRAVTNPGGVGGSNNGGAGFATPVAALPVVQGASSPMVAGEPVPRPELFFQKERAWATAIHNGDKQSLGAHKDQRVTEFVRHLDRMSADPDASLPDYLAYVLYTQIRVLGSKKLLHWPPYTDYLNSKLFFQAYRLIHTGVSLSSVVTAGKRAGSKKLASSTTSAAAAMGPATKVTMPDGTQRTLEEVCKNKVDQIRAQYSAEGVESTPAQTAAMERAIKAVYQTRGAAYLEKSSTIRPAFLKPKVRDIRSRDLTFQEACTHQRLLTLLQSHLSAAPMNSFRDAEAEAPPAAADDGYIKPRELPLTPLWQEIIDEKVRYKHPGESWYNSRIEETKQMESELQEYDRVEKEQMMQWAAERGKVMGKSE